MTAATEVRTTLADSSRYYLYPPTGEQLDSVTTVISGTDAKPWLTSWAGGVSMAWGIDNMALVARTLEAEGRQAAIALGKEEAERIRQLKADAGTYVHDVQERLILWAASPGRTGADISLPVMPEHLLEAWYDDEPLTDVTDHMVDGFLQFVHDFNPKIEATEMAVFNQPLGIAGTLDMILVLYGYAILNGQVIASPGSILVLCVDTKTGKHPSGTWKEQLAAYRRMTECLLPMGDLHPMPRTNAGAVLHLRPEYPGGYLLMLVAGDDDEAAWERFRAAAGIYRDRQKVKAKPGKVIRPLRADGTMPGPRICDLASEGYGRALSPLGKALGPAAELEDLARFTVADVLAVRGVGPKLIETIRVMLADHGLSLAGEATASGEAA